MAAISIWLRRAILIHLIANASLDDELFIHTARYLKAGHWLGPYNDVTLVKGMMYPLFICATSLAAIPLKVAEQAAYLAAAALTAGLARRRFGNNHLALVLFGLLAFNPVLWNVKLARVIREGLYVSLSLAVVALAVLIAFPTHDDGDHYGRRILQGFSLGLIGGAFWLTREEGIWLLPTLAVVLAVALLGILQPDWVPHSERGVFQRRSDHVKSIALPFVVALAVFYATVGLVAGLNYRHYGISETNEFRAKSFLRAYGALGRIQHNEWRRYVFFPKDARQRAYSVSPAAGELRPFLDGSPGEAWRREGCKYVDMNPCSEVPTGWFIWELRDAVAYAGHYGSAVEAMHFYDTLANEIDDACARRSIDCLPPRTTLLPPFRREYLWKAVRGGKAVADVLFTMGNGVVGSAPSLGSPQEIDAFAKIVDGVYPPSILTIQGWAAAVSGTPTVRLYSHGEQPAQNSIGMLPSQDILAAYPGLKVSRFHLETDCPVEACDLVVGETEGQLRVPMVQLVPGASFQTPGVILTIETASVPDTTKSAGGVRVKIAAILASGYAIAFPILAILGAFGLMLATLFQRRRPIPTSMLALGLGSVVAVVTRIGLLAYIDASSFPASKLHYVSPASPFVIIFTILGIYSGCSVAGHKESSPDRTQA